MCVWLVQVRQGLPQLVWNTSAEELVFTTLAPSTVARANVTSTLLIAQPLNAAHANTSSKTSDAGGLRLPVLDQSVLIEHGERARAFFVELRPLFPNGTVTAGEFNESNAIAAVVINSKELVMTVVLHENANLTLVPIEVSGELPDPLVNGSKSKVHTTWKAGKRGLPPHALTGGFAEELSGRLASLHAVLAFAHHPGRACRRFSGSGERRGREQGGERWPSGRVSAGTRGST
jgi:hypothetical protein